MSGALNTIYRKRNFKIYDAGKEYIIHNTKLDFHNHHTHINNFHTCKYIIDLCIHKTVPYHLSDYLLVSIIRITEDKCYKKAIELKLEENKKKRGKNNGKGKYKSTRSFRIYTSKK